MRLSFALILVLTLMPTASRAAANPVQQLVDDARVARALEWLQKNTSWITEQQVRITEVPAPPFEEEARGAALKRLLESAGLRVRVDDIGNVIAERSGSRGREVVLVTAHLDTVFPAGTEVRARREGTRLYLPGISDNGTGLATLVALAHALHHGRVRTNATVIFAANVGEEGEGNLRGMRKLMETYGPRVRAVIVLDGSSTDHITNRALASRRIEAVVRGPGGHSWAHFGLPNPINALARGITRLARVRIPDQPRTSLNVGTIEGGTSVNSIPHRAAIKVDIRSESPVEIDRVEHTLREALRAGVEEEMNAARIRNGKLELEFQIIGERPGGELADDAPLVEAVRSVDRFLNIRSRLERSSTDANVPLSMGLPAISIGGGGEGGGAHSLNEWYDPTNRLVGLKRALLTVLRVAGVQQ